ncbi:MAG: tetratricopeptide repeat protein [Thermoanaerobaculia bacterium]|nr:tetratricopeptide repeat protein [Thermoanaerobaculia bacterium]
MTTEEDFETGDDHLPPPVPAAKQTREKKPRAAAAPEPRLSPWADRATFLVLGLLAGFTAAYLVLDKSAAGPPQAGAADPHAGLTGVGPGATRDLPGSGGGQPSLASDPVALQKLAGLEAAVAKEPKNAALLVQLGNTAYDVEDWKKAIDAYERALKLNDGDPNVLTDLGVAYRNSGNPDKALGLFAQAVARDPSHWPSQFNQAIVLGLDRGDTKKALEILGRLKKEHPEIPAIDRLVADIERRTKTRGGA